MGCEAHVLFFRDLGGEAEGARRSVQGNPEDRRGPTRPLDSWFSELTFEEGVCWAFGIDEGDLDELYWRLSYYEIVGRLKLKYGELNATLLCHYTSIAEVANHVFGDGSSGGKDPERVDLTEGAPSFEAAIANINSALSFG